MIDVRSHSEIKILSRLQAEVSGHCMFDGHHCWKVFDISRDLVFSPFCTSITDLNTLERYRLNHILSRRCHKLLVWMSCLISCNVLARALRWVWSMTFNIYAANMSSAVDCLYFDWMAFQESSKGRIQHRFDNYDHYFRNGVKGLHSQSGACIYTHAHSNARFFFFLSFFSGRIVGLDQM